MTTIAAPDIWRTSRQSNCKAVKICENQCCACAGSVSATCHWFMTVWQEAIQRQNCLNRTLNLYPSIRNRKSWLLPHPIYQVKQELTNHIESMRCKKSAKLHCTLLLGDVNSFWKSLCKYPVIKTKVSYYSINFLQVSDHCSVCRASKNPWSKEAKT